MGSLFVLSSGVLFSYVFGWGVFLFVSSFLFINVVVFHPDSVSFFFELSPAGWSLSALTLMLFSLLVVSGVSFFYLDLFKGGFIVVNCFLLALLLLTFFVCDYLSFYVFYECCVIPMFFLVLGWGFSPERLQAALYMLMYCVVFSFPFLFIIWVSYSSFGGLSFLFFHWSYFKALFGMMVLFSLGVFLVKVPMFFCHLWLPKAHVEAPLIGSMLLAGILLKLGGYGLIVAMFLGGLSAFYYGGIFTSLLLLGGVLAGLVCIRQVDLKCLVAFSSISHMSLAIAGVFSFNGLGVLGGVFMMLAHGLSSSGLFFMLNVFYERSFSRSMFVNRGGLLTFPSVGLWVFLLVCINMAAPPSFSFLSELFLVWSLVVGNLFNLVFFSMLMFFGGVYSIRLFVTISHGVNTFVSSLELTLRESLIFFGHLFPLCVAFLLF